MTDRLYAGSQSPVTDYPTFMRTQLLKKLTSISCLGIAVALACTAAAQLSVGPGGLPTQTFDTQPTSDQWSTRTIGAAAADIQNATQMDAAVQAVAASSINGSLLNVAGNPPGQNASASWSNDRFFIDTRPTGNAATLLMATLRNNVGSNVSQIIINFTRTLSATTPGEEIFGHSVYYSVGGAANSWQKITALSGLNTSGAATATLSLGSWTPGSNLYLLFADDNGIPGTDAAVEIDNFSAVFPWPVITNQPVAQSGLPGSTVTFTVGASGPNLSYQWRKDGTNIPGATASSLTLVNVQPSNNGNYTVFVSNPNGSVLSSTANLVVACSAPVAIATQPVNQQVQSGSTLNISLGVTGTAPFSYQWYKNGTPIANATNAVYSKPNVQAGDSGFYYVQINNCGGSATSTNVLVAVSDPSVVLVGWTNTVWRYEQSGADLGTAWKETNFTGDSTWLTGRGVFAREDRAEITPFTNTVLVLTNVAAERFVTNFYFRTTFVFTNDPAVVNIVVTNQIDDGEVLYLNGREIYRYNMPSGTILATTFASGALTEPIEPFVTNIPAGLLLQGTNVLAVEVHQNSIGSSDAVMGLSLTAVFPIPSVLSITNPLQDVTVEETKRAELAIGIQGAPAYYQWYHDGVPVTNSYSNPLVFAAATTNDAGSYYVIVTNAINAVTSSIVTLSVLADTNPPTLLEADGSISTTNVLVSYSELVLPETATNTGNYRITNSITGTTVSITRAVLQNGTNVLLTTAARASGTNYILIVNNVKDTAPRQNQIAANSAIPISVLLSAVVPFDAFYQYYQPQYRFFDPSPDQGTNWRNTDFTVPAYWSSGFAPFIYSVLPYDAPFTANTTLGQSELFTSYYRTLFNSAASPGGAKVYLRHFVDDAGIFYLNGVEVSRFNIPAGAVDYQTRPILRTDYGSMTDPILLPEGALRTGTNLFAVELHQWSEVDTDAVYTAQIDIKAQSLIIGPVIITGGPQDQTVVEGAPATFAVVQAAGRTFQWRQNGSNISGATNSTYTIPATPLSFNSNTYSVVVANTNSSATSTNALLRVVRDTNGPTLVYALLNTSNNTITVTYSEPVQTPSATTIANYKITNSLGAVQTPSGASLVGGTNVVLTFGSIPLAKYIIVVNNVRDASSNTNLIAPNSAIVAGYNAFVQAMSGSWRYNDDGSDLGTAWKTLAYNDSAWSVGQALLGAKDGTVPTGLPEPLRTTLSISNNDGSARVFTYYFRTYFNAIAANSATLTLRTIVDDGCVIHVNGAEVYRLGMPGGIISYGTFANRTVNGPGDTPAIEGPISVTITNLVSGQNVIAVEAHQNSATSSDMYWAGEFGISIPPVVIPPPPVTPACSNTVASWTYPKLNYERLTTNTVRLSWTNPLTNNCPSNRFAAMILQQAVRLTNNSSLWVDMGTNSPVTITTTNSERYFRFKQQ